MPAYYSIVIPVYNSAQTLPELINRINAVFKDKPDSFEIVCVDDASEDNSWEVLKTLKHQYQHVKIIGLSRNYGQHNATLCGFEKVSGNIVVTLDDDLQHNPEDIILLSERMNETGADVVYGVAKNNMSPVYRKAGSKSWKFFSRKLRQGYGDGSSFRMIKREVADKVSSHKQHFVFIDQLLYWYTQHTQFVKVDHKPRLSGKTGYSPAKLFFLSSDLLIFYTSLPLRWMTYSGIILSGISFLTGIYFLLRKLFLNVKVEGFTALIVTLLFVSSILLLCFGIIGAYLARIYTMLNNKPSYSIKEMHL